MAGLASDASYHVLGHVLASKAVEELCAKSLLSNLDLMANLTRLNTLPFLREASRFPRSTTDQERWARYTYLIATSLLELTSKPRQVADEAAASLMRACLTAADAWAPDAWDQAEPGQDPCRSCDTQCWRPMHSFSCDSEPRSAGLRPSLKDVFSACEGASLPPSRLAAWHSVAVDLYDVIGTFGGSVRHVGALAQHTLGE